MLSAFLTIVAIASIFLYVLFIFEVVPGAAEERLGVAEPLPEDVGKWHVDTTTSEGKLALEQGRQREERVFFEEGQGLFGQGRLVRQVRYRNTLSAEIEEVERDTKVRRKRIRI